MSIEMEARKKEIKKGEKRKKRRKRNEERDGCEVKKRGF